MLGRLLHLANSSPTNKPKFYRMKERILNRYGTEDGVDVQYIPGKKCFSCDGTGLWHLTYSGDPDDCWNCVGGWYKRPKWVTLKRYKIGTYSFHKPESTIYEKPVPDVTRIIGYVEHPAYPWKVTERAELILALLFDWDYAKYLFPHYARDHWRWWRVVTRRCGVCRKRVWRDRAIHDKCRQEIPF